MNEVFEKLSAYFKGKTEISMAFLFGSVSAGREISESDVDVAIWLAGTYSLEKVSSIQGEIEDLLHRSIDLIVLNQARPTIAWSAMRGKPLVIRDHRLYFSKLLEISTEAEDMQDFNISLFNLRQKIKKEAGR